MEIKFPGNSFRRSYLLTFTTYLVQPSLSFTTCIHMSKLPGNFTFVHYLDSFYYTCHEQLSLSFTTWIQSAFYQCFTSVSPVFTRFSQVFNQRFRIVSKVFQKCIKSVTKMFQCVSKLFVCIEVIATTRGYNSF